MVDCWTSTASILRHDYIETALSFAFVYARVKRGGYSALRQFIQSLVQGSKSRETQDVIFARKPFEAPSCRRRGSIHDGTGQGTRLPSLSLVKSRVVLSAGNLGPHDHDHHWRDATCQAERQPPARRETTAEKAEERLASLSCSSECAVLGILLA
jgi:hypothetical protein